jgi:kynurenine formamidase
MKLYLDSASYIDTANPLDISIPLVSGSDNLRAWYVDSPVMEPVRANGFTGSVNEGGSVNFRTIQFNPHGHGTHTECLGHITNTVHSVNQSVKQFFCKAQLVTLDPIKSGEDTIITLEQFEALNWQSEISAVIIRTNPNHEAKKHLNYSGTNPTYFESGCVDVLNRLGIIHFIVDLPSVDREHDHGELAFHHKFWGIPDNPDFKRTITELAFIEDTISDGVYVLDLQLAPFENDAAPSRPLLYEVFKS